MKGKFPISVLYKALVLHHLRQLSSHAARISYSPVSKLVSHCGHWQLRSSLTEWIGAISGNFLYFCITQCVLDYVR